MYEIAAIPTLYKGVRFRSRLEARWAAFFDLIKLRWEYEPFDLKGWAPDFLIKAPIVDVLAEVKPACFSKDGLIPFEKVKRYIREHQILCLGREPILSDGGGFISSIGMLCDPPDGAPYKWLEMWSFLNHEGRDTKSRVSLWAEAGNIVQWRPRG